MPFSVGERVRVVDDLHSVDVDGYGVNPTMEALQGKIVTIARIVDHSGPAYRIEEDGHSWTWGAKFLEPTNRGKKIKKPTYKSVYLNEIFNIQDLPL